MPFKPLENYLSTGTSAQPSGGFRPLSTTQVATEPVQGFGDRIWSALAGYTSRVGESYKEGAQNIISSIQDVPKQIKAGETPSVVAGRVPLRIAGQVARSAFAPIVEAVAPVVEPAIKSVVESSPMLQQVIQKASDLASKYPEAAKDIQDFVDIATLGIGSAVEKPLAAEVKAVGKDIVSGVKIALTPSEQAIESKVTTLFQKSIKPTAKKTLTQAEKYDNNVIRALKTIKDNAPNLNIEDTAGEIISGRTPQTVNELAQAVDQTKKNVFTQYDSLAKQANKIGATVDTETIANEVAQVANNKALQISNPEVIAYAESWARRLKEFGKVDAETSQAVIQNLNNGLQAFYKNPTYEAASKVTIDAGIANNFRKLLDDAIENATGKEYQALKNQYAALKAIETDVTRAAMRDARKNVKGLLDYSDIFTGGQMISGIFSLNPAMFTKGAVERGFKEFYKYLNDPNRAIKNIFDELDIVPNQTFEPQSAIGKFLANPKAGLSIEDVSKKAEGDGLESLVQEARKFKNAEEFVKAQGTPVYRGGKLNNNQITSRGISATTDEKIAQRFPIQSQTTQPIYNESGQLVKYEKVPLPTESFVLLKDAKVLGFDEIPKKFLSETPNGVVMKLNAGEDMWAGEQRIVDYAKAKGFDAVDLQGLVKGAEKEIRIINPDILKTKSQLTDFYNRTVKGDKLPAQEFVQGKIGEKEYRAKWLKGQMEASPGQPKQWYESRADEAVKKAKQLDLLKK